MNQGAAIWMPPRYVAYLKARAQNGGAVTLTALSLLAPAEVGFQLGDYIRPDADRSHVTLSQGFDVDVVGTAINGVVTIPLALEASAGDGIKRTHRTLMPVADIDPTPGHRATDR